MIGDWIGKVVPTHPLSSSPRRTRLAHSNRVINISRWQIQIYFPKILSQPVDFVPLEQLELEHPQEQQQPSYECKYCTSTFSSESELSSHALNHTSKSYVCDFCGEPQSCNKSLSNHLGLLHRERCSVCSVCGRAFSNVRALKLHRRTHHEEKRNPVRISYNCLVCQASYNSMKYLKVHMSQSHSDENQREV